MKEIGIIEKGNEIYSWKEFKLKKYLKGKLVEIFNSVCRNLPSILNINSRNEMTTYQEFRDLSAKMDLI